MVGDSQRTLYRGLMEGISVWDAGSGAYDPYTQTIQPADPRWVLLSGVMGSVQEGDALLGMGGRVGVGDFVAKFVYLDVESYLDTPKIRREATGEVFSVEARVRTGLGPSFTRLELLLKKKQNE